MVKSCGCKIVEIGHAERYKYFNETDILVNKKIIQAIKNNLIPLVCFGEEKKISNIVFRKKELIKKINTMFKNINLKQNKKIILAYEPVWAIGTGLTPKELEIFEIVNFIKNKVKGSKVLYGGSVNSKNINFLKKINNVDGFLIGGASQNSKNFIDIIKKTFI